MTNPTPMGKRIRTRRVSLGMRRKELAAKVGKSYDYIAGIENGHKRGSPETLVDIAKALGMPLELVMPSDWTGAA